MAGHGREVIQQILSLKTQSLLSGKEFTGTFLAFGTMLKRISVITILLSFAVLIFVILTAKKEEKENIQFFGTDYEDYMKKTKMFVPFIF
jgi:protein-S-isoprenylcysteine O-methyltransferase Ste14